MCVTDLDVATALTRERLRSLSRSSSGSLGMRWMAATAIGATSTSAQTPTSTSTTTTRRPHAIVRGGPKKQVRKAVEAVLTSGDAADACGRYVTEHYLKAAYGDRQGCVQAQGRGSAARSLHSFRARFGAAGTASAVAVPAGGPYAGAKVRISLIEGGPGYQVDAVHSNVPVGP